MTPLDNDAAQTIKGMSSTSTIDLTLSLTHRVKLQSLLCYTSRRLRDHACSVRHITNFTLEEVMATARASFGG